MTLDDLRKIAEAATSGPWTVEQEVEETDFGKIKIFSVDPVTAFSWYDDSAMAHTALDTLEEADAEFIATFNPQRVLEMIDQIEASKSLIEDCWDRLAAVEKLHSPVEAIAANGDTITVCDHCVGDLAYVFDEQMNWPCDTIKAARGE